MSVAAVAAQVRSALTGTSTSGVEAAIVEVEKLAPRERLELVLSNTWGELILARLPNDEIFGLLRVLSDARPPPPLRDRFYASFDFQGLCEACAEQLRVSSSKQTAINTRLCIRNLARNPVFRLRLSAAVSILASSLQDDEDASRVNLEVAAASAAALCNICCDNAFKMEAVRRGVVPPLLQNLNKTPTYAAAEDFVACIGVLTAGFPPGIEALFNSGEAPVLLACLYNSEHSALQVLAAEVLSDLCSCSKSFTAWLVGDTDLVQNHLGGLLSLDGDPDLLSTALNLCTRLAETDEFAAKIQKGTAVKALQTISELPAEPSALDAFDVDDVRRPPTKQEKARALLGKIFHF
mmetsp:Transcript_160355/g.307742  ORF Transcript_160355/g.307742 Transcript_160355/m.307742 type:complete len:351 (-) Transcript_160355:214-1266(-)